MKQKKRGQAAIEFLTTYGWAFMAIIIAMGALYYFDVLDTDRYVLVECETGPQIACIEASLDEEGNLTLRLQNNQPVDLYIQPKVTMDGLIADYPVPEEKTVSGQVYLETQSIGDINLNVGDKKELDIEIKFGRTIGVPYSVFGSSTLRVVPAGVDATITCTTYSDCRSYGYDFCVAGECKNSCIPEGDSCTNSICASSCTCNSAGQCVAIGSGS
ncbi:hypothetical protein K9L97_00985 [Candidatus Woesearchaeota archaeon]|nr:hypothetical protein [Candidatus Woesearchaeota archaeon]